METPTPRWPRTGGASLPSLQVLLMRPLPRPQLPKLDKAAPPGQLATTHSPLLYTTVRLLVARAISGSNWDVSI